MESITVGIVVVKEVSSLLPGLMLVSGEIGSRDTYRRYQSL